MTGPDLAGPEPLRVTDLSPYLSIAVLECVDGATDVAFRGLIRFVCDMLTEPGRAVAVRIVGQTVIDSPDDVIEGLGSMAELGFDGLLAIVRERKHRPGWADPTSEITDVTNELTLALRRKRLVALRTTITDAALRRWMNQPTTPYRLVPADVVSGTFRGDGKAVWLQGVHPRRPTKPDGKMLAGQRVQELVNTIDDSTSVMSAVRVKFLPSDDNAVLRGDLTTNSRSRVAWAARPDLATFFLATAEALDHIDKTLVGEEPPDPLFPELPVPQAHLANVHGAFDVGVANPGGVPLSDQDAEDDPSARAELLRERLLNVHGDPSSATLRLDVGRHDTVEGTLTIRPVALRTGVELTVTSDGPLSPAAEEVQEALADGDLLTVYYESGHAITTQRIYRQNLDITPFTNIEFEDFTGFTVTSEKPDAKGDQAIHDAIGVNGGTSLFAWVATHFIDGWLLCDDGAGEVADFLHLDNHGTLKAIHVKAAKSASPNRRIAVVPFEVVVSQATKNVRALDNDTLAERLSRPRIATPATWYDGERVASRSGFVDQLHARVARDRTEIVIVQPHLLEDTHDRARTAAKAGRPNRDSRSLAVLDLLLHSTRRSTIPQCDNLTVIGCAATGNGH
jgi:hypothetical protein